MSFDLARYLARIGLAEAPAADRAGLFALHEAQARAFTFENLDVLAGVGPSVDEDAFAEKLLTTPRGGYCFELNGLLRMALHALGFHARPLLGRVMVRRAPGEDPGPKTHLVNLVRLDGEPWIADCGFGGGVESLDLLALEHLGGADCGFGGGLPLHPIRLEAGSRSVHLDATLRYVEGELGWTLQKQEGDGWRDLYALSLEPVFPADIVMGNHFTSTHPGSPFKRQPFLSRIVGDARITLLGDRLTHHRPEGEAVETIEEPERVMREIFALDP